MKSNNAGESGKFIFKNKEASNNMHRWSLRAPIPQRQTLSGGLLTLILLNIMGPATSGASLCDLQQ